MYVLNSVQLSVPLLNLSVIVHVSSMSRSRDQKAWSWLITAEILAHYRSVSYLFLRIMKSSLQIIKRKKKLKPVVLCEVVFEQITVERISKYVRVIKCEKIYSVVNAIVFVLDHIACDYKIHLITENLRVTTTNFLTYIWVFSSIFLHS